MKKITPLQSIRAYCKWCCNGQSHEVKLCPATKCPLHSRRLGKGGGRILKIIREKCLDWCGWYLLSPKTCTHDGIKEELCFLHPYRLGKRPKSQTTLSAKVLKQRIESGKRLQRLKAKKGGK